LVWLTILAFSGGRERDRSDRRGPSVCNARLVGRRTDDPLPAGALPDTGILAKSTIFATMFPRSTPRQGARRGLETVASLRTEGLVRLTNSATALVVLR